MENLYGQLDLTALGNLCRQHPQLVKKVNFRDGEHQLLNIDLFAKQQADQYGNAAVIKASCKKDEQVQGVNYYLANLKVSNYQNDNNNGRQTTVSQKTTAQGDQQEGNNLPF